MSRAMYKYRIEERVAHFDYELLSMAIDDTAFDEGGNAMQFLSKSVLLELYDESCSSDDKDYYDFILKQFDKGQDYLDVIIF